MTSRLQDMAPSAPENKGSMAAEPASTRPTLQLWPSRAERRAQAASADVRVARARVEAERARAQADHERLEHAQESIRRQIELNQLDADRRAAEAEHAARAKAAARARRRAVTRKLSLAVVLACANGGVNLVAVLGQILALVLGLGWPWWAALPVALIAESVAVNVGYFAHDKLIKGYSAIWLRLLSYGIGAAVGLFNYSHTVAIPATADFAIVFGGASLLSPVLWQIYSQWRHWELLRERGMLDPSAPNFGLRWIVWFGETWFIWRRAVRYGVSDRNDADARFRPAYEVRKPAPAITSSDQEPADEETDERQPDLLNQEPEPDTDTDTSPDTSSDRDEGQDGDRERPDDQDNRAAETWIKRQMREGRLPTHQQTADRFGFSKGWARLRVQAARDAMTARGYRILPGNIVQQPTSTSTDPVTTNDHARDQADDQEMTDAEVA